MWFDRGKYARALLIGGVAVVSMAPGCANLSSHAAGTPDSLEPVNRSIYDFNDYLDRKIAKPVADTYVRITHENVRLTVSNFFDNIRYFNVILNDVLQGKGQQGLSDMSRFLMNSTVGIGGLFDVASEFGFEAQEEDFGQTLGVWGAGEGSYLVLPILGPSSFRDAPDLLVSTVTNGLFYVGVTAVTFPLAILAAIDKRVRADKAFNFRDKAAVEPYVFTREAYLEHRRYLIYDGSPPLDDEFLEEIFDNGEGDQPSPPDSP